jgi:hypothetical protein
MAVTNTTSSASFEWNGQLHSIGRAKPSIHPATPEHYWDINFPSEEEQIKRGETIIATSPLFKQGSKKQIITTDTSGLGLSSRPQTPAQMSVPFKGPPLLQPPSAVKSVTSQNVASSPNIPFAGPAADENKQLQVFFITCKNSNIFIIVEEEACTKEAIDYESAFRLWFSPVTTAKLEGIFHRVSKNASNFAPVIYYGIPITQGCQLRGIVQR